MAEIRHLENRHDVIFSADSGPIWIKFRRLVQNDMSTAVMWSKSQPVLPLGEFTVTIPEPHATLQGIRISSAVLKIVFFAIFVFNAV